MPPRIERGFTLLAECTPVFFLNDRFEAFFESALRFMFGPLVCPEGMRPRGVGYLLLKIELILRAMIRTSCKTANKGIRCFGLFCSIIFPPVNLFGCLVSRL